MTHLNEFLTQYLREQIGLEEHLCKVIEQQISDIEDDEFGDARELLNTTRRVLEEQFEPLNALLDSLEDNAHEDKTTMVEENGKGTKISTYGSPPQTTQEERKGRISRILQDDYSALNLITMSNTLLHTTALALNSDEVAKTSLRHLKNLAPLVVKLGEILPQVVARELRAESDNIDLTVEEKALQNAQQAWRFSDTHGD